MSIRDLRYVVAVADTLNFHAAARRCCVTQPTLSIQVRKFESYLGVELFERSRVGVRVTRAGRQVVELARIAIDAYDDMRRIGRARRFA
jgi:LysR family hydrogen peroxide-inducible transcriptional activator